MTPDLERAREAAYHEMAIAGGIDEFPGEEDFAKAIDAFLAELSKTHVVLSKEPDAMYASDMGKQLNAGVSVQEALKTYLRNAG